MEIEDLFDAHGALSFEKQLRLADLVGESSWRFNMSAGVLAFDAFNVAVQILGTVSEYSKTWLWAWANPESNIPPSLLAASERVRSFGQSNQVLEFIEPQLEVEPFDNGHMLAMVAVGILNAAAYYRAPYEGGAAFLIIPDLPELPKDSRPPALQITSDFMRFIAAHECDHKTAFESYLRSKEYQGHPIQAVFDSKGRLVKLDAQISGPGG